MQADFYALADHLTSRLQGNEVFTAGYNGERSDFVRFNHNRIRQPGVVSQGGVQLRLIDGKRHATVSLPFAGGAAVNYAAYERALTGLRELLKVVPEDPYLLYNTDVYTSERLGENRLPSTADSVDAILTASADRDLVGILAQGGIFGGFASSLGQRNWFSSYSFSFDFSYYLRDDKAVKSSYGGFEWKQSELDAKVANAGRQLALLDQKPRAIEPGSYRVYLAPAALQEIVNMMSWGGFGKRAHATKQTPFLKMVEGEAQLSSSIHLRENTAEGVSPDFSSDGFAKPPEVVLISEGQYRNCLISPRSAMEFDCTTNGAGPGESPASLDLAGGALPSASALARLGTGVYVNNLWYLNFSDRNAFRITGMTRFATFWVENGEIKAPLSVMRFDESMYRMLGSNLLELTAEREMLLSTETYGGRGTSSARLPGALIDDFRFTL